MSTYVGIDLGTTNSAICTYDGTETRVYKSPEQNDVTPSAILYDRRSTYHGRRAYDMAPHQPGRAAQLFKRFMGTSTRVELPAADKSLTPEECSAEILKVLFGYLPEEVRNAPETGTVITVPAAFNQMQKNATMEAANVAGIGRVALMQEPVAAVMSVMRARSTDGQFLIYDLGGGTLDIAIGESLGGRVNLLSHGGIAMCGGRDFDRLLVDNLVRPWLVETFALPDDWSTSEKYNRLLRVGLWATERAKIELSAREETRITVSEPDVRLEDLNGAEVYFDIPLTRAQMDPLIAEKVEDSIQAARETLSKAGLTAHDFDRIVFVGGPTNYKPLRDKVSEQLGIPASTEVNPMTAVAEGASLFAESIDWSTQQRSRKSTRGQLAAGKALAVTFSYISRTPDTRARIAAQVTGKVADGAQFQVDSLETGWTSGRMPLKHGATVDLTLASSGENRFKVYVFDAAGGPVKLDVDIIVITRTAATVDAIPASHSVGVEVLERLGGKPVLHYLVRAGDALPVKGTCRFKAGESLKAGSPGSLKFRLWEGDIEDPIKDNRPIGALEVSGGDFTEGVIPAGADLDCQFEILDSGAIVLEVSVPSISNVFRSRNFYSRTGSGVNYDEAAPLVLEEGERAMQRLEEMCDVVNDPKLDQARRRLEDAVGLDPEEADPERTQEAMEGVHAARRILAEVRKENLKEIRQVDLNSVVAFFNDHIREHARPSEASNFDSLARTAQRAIDRNERDFEHHLDELKGRNFQVLWRQDWFVIERFKHMAASPHHFADRRQFQELVHQGQGYMASDDIDRLREVVGQLWSIQVGGSADEDMLDATNILRG